VTAVRVILITVAGPGGHVDVGVRSDATPAELAASLGSVLGVSPAWPAAEHRSPPRPGVPRGWRALLQPGIALADAGVADGDLILFSQADDGSRGATPQPQAAMAEPAGAAALPHRDTGALPHGDAGALPHRDTGALPHRDAGALPHRTAVPQPERTRGPLPEDDTGPLPRREAGPFQPSAAGAIPEPPEPRASPRPPHATGSAPEPGAHRHDRH
jgi:hypothetical protein